MSTQNLQKYIRLHKQNISGIKMSIECYPYVIRCNNHEIDISGWLNGCPISIIDNIINYLKNFSHDMDDQYLKIYCHGDDSNWITLLDNVITLNSFSVSKYVERYYLTIDNDEIFDNKLFTSIIIVCSQSAIFEYIKLLTTKYNIPGKISDNTKFTAKEMELFAMCYSSEVLVFDNMILPKIQMTSMVSVTNLTLNNSMIKYSCIFPNLEQLYITQLIEISNNIIELLKNSTQLHTLHVETKSEIIEYLVTNTTITNLRLEYKDLCNDNIQNLLEFNNSIIKFAYDGHNEKCFSIPIVSSNIKKIKLINVILEKHHIINILDSNSKFTFYNWTNHSVTNILLHRVQAKYADNINLANLIITNAQYDSSHLIFAHNIFLKHKTLYKYVKVIDQ